ncbi:MAG TPA: LamG domain-containing protein, partial [Humisphaera sp.]
RYWSMDAETGTSGIADFAVVGRSARFDGLRAAVPTGLTVGQLGDRWTVGGWVRPLQRTDDRVEPVFAARDEQGAGFAVSYDGGAGSYVLDALPAGPRPPGGGAAPRPRPPHPVRSFQHVAVIVALGRAALYVDGELAGRLELPAAPRARLSIGSDGRAGEGFRGLIDEVRLWDRALIAAELADVRQRDKDAAEVDPPRLDRLDADLEPGGDLK